MATYQILYWRDIPAQLKIYDGRRPIAHQLEEAFQVEIDRIAMEEGLEGSDEYLDQWKWSKKQDRDGTPEEVAQALKAEIRAEFDHLFKQT